MNSSALQPIPRWPPIIQEHFRTIGAANRRELALIGLALGVSMLWITYYAQRVGESFPWDHTEMPLFGVLLALLAPLAVWKEGEPSRRSYFWTMPVDRGRHTLMKVFAGWAWVMVLIAVFLLWGVAVATLTGGEIGLGPSVIRVLSGELAPGSRIVERTFQGNPWLWLVPFTSATVAYLLASIVVLSTDYPWRWGAGIWLSFVLPVALLDEVVAEFLDGALSVRYGLRASFAGTSEQAIVLSNELGARVEGMLRLPDLQAWAVATTAWLVVALAGVVVAGYRHQER